MKLLLDTQVVIWLATDRTKVKSSVIAKLVDPDSSRYVSVVSAWEYSQKRRLRPRDLPHEFDSLLGEAGAERLDFAFGLHRYAETLPLIHRDPFDRMLIAQALHAGMTLVTSDGMVKRYSVNTLW